MRIFAVILVVSLALFIGVFMGVGDIHYKSEVLAKETKESKGNKEMIATVMRDKEENARELQSFADKGQIRISIPQNVKDSDVKLNENIISSSYQVVIPNAGSDYFDTNPILGSVSRIDDFYTYDDGGNAYFDITLNGVYECKPTIENGFIYLDFQDPHKIYDNVLVVDAGHGGKDVGAIQGDIQEKDINLAIVLKLKELLDADLSIKTYYTRTDDANPTLRERVNLANDVGADLFLSVHNNSITGFGRSMTSGTQVLYYVSDPSGNSKVFADILLDKLCAALGSVNRGLVNGDDILIIHNSKAPVALVEVGFMSQNDELKKLTDESYQRKCAKALYDSIKEMIDITYKE